MDTSDEFVPLWILIKIYFVCIGLYLVRFSNMNDQLTVANRGLHFFDRKPLLVKPWNPEIDLNTEAISSLPIWVQFLGLDLKYWGLENLSKIRSILGIPLKTDKYAKDKTFLKYARVLIDIPLDREFLEYLEFINDHRVSATPAPSGQNQAFTISNTQNSFEALTELNTPSHGQPAGICNWNIQGLNRPNKQEDLKVFLHQQKISLIGLLETKIKEINIDKLANILFQDQAPIMFRSFKCLLNTYIASKQFYLTFVYGYNQAEARQPLWDALLISL
ncbi:hypothetical protein Cgig2_003262 [Carnegiea gigantea]|uniref:DUF4283 domain-containing protein n=1 Tax=Carnegiea gigantea TaxID=171969 RepID=A0A9Q1GP13_9CARY|nr:hypothetical protein Cgig2_003262 [Carnegiea gigantea]